jgi:hypothetical protein
LNINEEAYERLIRDVRKKQRVGWLTKIKIKPADADYQDAIAPLIKNLNSSQNSIEASLYLFRCCQGVFIETYKNLLKNWKHGE